VTNYLLKKSVASVAHGCIWKCENTHMKHNYQTTAMLRTNDLLALKKETGKR